SWSARPRRTASWRCRRRTGPTGSRRGPARWGRPARCAPMSPAPPPGQPIDVRERADEDASMSGTVLLVGTRKGLWIGTSDEAREEWKFTGPHHNMEEVYSCMVDTRSDP